MKDVDWSLSTLDQLVEEILDAQMGEAYVSRYSEKLPEYIPNQIDAPFSLVEFLSIQSMM
jgi:hypothetical protein